MRAGSRAVAAARRDAVCGGASDNLSQRVTNAATNEPLLCAEGTWTMTRTRLATVVAICGLALGLATVAACGGSAKPGSATTYTEADNLTTVTGTVGQTVTVELNENQSAGYRWTTKVSPGIKIVSTTYTAPPSASPAATVTAGLRTWVLEFTRTGAQKFSATYEAHFLTPAKQAIPQYQLVIDVK
jgi:predicted secreted protein